MYTSAESLRYNLLQEEHLASLGRSMLRLPERREALTTLDRLGLNLPDRFIVGPDPEESTMGIDAVPFALFPLFTLHAERLSPQSSVDRRTARQLTCVCSVRT